MANSSKLVPFILQWEGGFVNDPDDLGGATNKGITIGAFTEYRRKKGLSAPTVKDLKTYPMPNGTTYSSRCIGIGGRRTVSTASQ